MCWCRLNEISFQITQHRAPLGDRYGLTCITDSTYLSVFRLALSNDVSGPEFVRSCFTLTTNDWTEKKT
jgi:hypothetical protein